MYNYTVVARTFAMVAIALLIIGMGVNSSWAGSDQTSGLKFTPISFEGGYRSGTKVDNALRFTQACMHFHEGCSLPPDMRFPCCGGAEVCKPNQIANGLYWCLGDVR